MPQRLSQAAGPLRVGATISSEPCRGGGVVGPQSDVYSFGVMLYQREEIEGAWEGLFPWALRASSDR